MQSINVLRKEQSHKPSFRFSYPSISIFFHRHFIPQNIWIFYEYVELAWNVHSEICDSVDKRLIKKLLLRFKEIMTRNDISIKHNTEQNVQIL